MVLGEQFGIAVPQYEGVSYETENDRAHIAQYMNEQRELHWKRIDPGEARPGDVILFRMLGVPIHVGVLCGNDLFLHCERGCNSCVERLQSSAWKRRIEGFYRPRL
jgi:cell wall-associated NlpC family hydrolase